MHLEAGGLMPTADVAVDSLPCIKQNDGMQPPAICFQPDLNLQNLASITNAQREEEQSPR